MIKPIIAPIDILIKDRYRFIIGLSFDGVSFLAANLLIRLFLLMTIIVLVTRLSEPLF